jgi:PTS system nitrogen regulatory IIA component
MRILEFLDRDAIIASLQSTTKQGALAELVEPIAHSRPGMDKDRLLKILVERETLGSTGIGDGIAIPHGAFDGIEALTASFGKSDSGVDFDSMDNKPAHLFFLLVAPKNSAGEHLKALARISRLFKDPILKRELLDAKTSDEIYRIMEESDSRLA